jgi:hypothetical protein
MALTREKIAKIVKVIEEGEEVCDRCAVTKQFERYNLERAERQRKAIVSAKHYLNKIQRRVSKLVLTDLDTNFITRAGTLKLIKWARADLKKGAKI